MPSYVPPKKNDTNGCIFYVSLRSQTNVKIMQANPTLAAGDVQIAVDDAAPGNLGTLPAVDADFTKRVKVTLSQAETNGDNLTIIFSDASGDEWCDLTINIQTSAQTLDEIVQAIWDKATSALTTVGSIGKLLVDNINATISSRSSHTAADVWAVAARTLTSFGTLAADVWAVGTRTLTSFGTLAQDIWDKLTSGLTAVGSIGKLLVDNINATISSRSSHAAADVWSVVTRALTDKAGFTISGTKTTLDDLNDISATQVNAAVDTALSDYAPALETTAQDIKAQTDKFLFDVSNFVKSIAQNSELAHLDADISSVTAEVDDLITRAKGLNEIYDSVVLRALEATLTTIKQKVAGTFDRETDSLEAIRDRGDAAWVTGVAATPKANFTA